MHLRHCQRRVQSSRRVRLGALRRSSCYLMHHLSVGQRALSRARGPVHRDGRPCVLEKVANLGGTSRYCGLCCFLPHLEYEGRAVGQPTGFGQNKFRWQGPCILPRTLRGRRTIFRYCITTRCISSTERWACYSIFIFRPPDVRILITIVYSST